MVDRNDLKEYLTNYENHLKQIYDFYSKLGNTKITFFKEEAIHLNEFKEFCVNFMIFGLLLSSDQINYIFKKISKRNQSTTEDIFYLKYRDFMVSIVYIALFLKISRKGSNKILPADLDKIDIITIKNLIEFMNLKIPYNKKELADFINDRRALSAKELIRLQNRTKKDKSDMVRSNAGGKSDTKLLSSKNTLPEALQKEKEDIEKADKLEQLRQEEKENIERKKTPDNSIVEEKRIKEMNKKGVTESAKKESENKKKIDPKTNNDKNLSLAKSPKK